MLVTYVRWRDACSQEGAEPGTPAKPMLADLSEVGFLVGESDEAITIAMELEADTPGRWRLHIPKVNIVERRDMEIAAAFPVAAVSKRRKRVNTCK